MNYLAHLSLSKGKGNLMTGNFIADNIPRKEERQLSEAIIEGIQLHRHIDNFTDQHAGFKRAVEQLRPLHGKYATVVVDILNDHLLSKNWDHYFAEPEHSFHEKVYKELEVHVESLPPHASLHVNALLEYRYLKAYGSKSGMKNVLSRMDRRTKFPSNFSASIDHLYDDFDFFK